MFYERHGLSAQSSLDGGTNALQRNTQFATSTCVRVVYQPSEKVGSYAAPYYACDGDVLRGGLVIGGRGYPAPERIKICEVALDAVGSTNSSERCKRYRDLFLGG